MEKIKAKFVTEIRTYDPDTDLIVHINILKLETGGMIGVDSSFFQTDMPVYSPFDNGIELDIG